MTAHDHREIVPGCYRCELGHDEVQRYSHGPEWHRVKSELLDKGWARVRAQPERTEAAARGIFYNIKRECGIRDLSTTFSRVLADTIVGWAPTLTDDDFDIREL